MAASLVKSSLMVCHAGEEFLEFCAMFATLLQSFVELRPVHSISVTVVAFAVNHAGVVDQKLQKQ